MIGIVARTVMDAIDLMMYEDVCDPGQMSADLAFAVAYDRGCTYLHAIACSAEASAATVLDGNVMVWWGYAGRYDYSVSEREAIMQYSIVHAFRSDW